MKWLLQSIKDFFFNDLYYNCPKCKSTLSSDYYCFKCKGTWEIDLQSIDKQKFITFIKFLANE